MRLFLLVHCNSVGAAASPKPIKEGFCWTPGFKAVGCTWLKLSVRFHNPQVKGFLLKMRTEIPSSPSLRQP